MPSQYYIKRGDKVNGPFTSDQIENGIKSKKIKPGDLLGSSDVGPWKEVRSIIKVTSDHNDKSKVSGSNDDLEDLSSFGGALPDTNHPPQVPLATQPQFEGGNTSSKSEPAGKKGGAKAAIIVACVLGCLGLLATAGLWIHSSMSASALAEAVQHQQWDEALAIDEQHVPALIGRANQRLNAAMPDIEGAFTDIGLAEQVDSTAGEIKPAKALAHLKRATVQATDGKISESEKDLKDAESLGASDTQLTTARQLLAAAYVKRGTAQATDGKISEAEKDLKEAESLGATASSVTAAKQLLAAEYVKRATAQATDGKISEAEKDFKQAESLGADEHILLAARSILAAAFLEKAKQALVEKKVATIRSACAAAEGYGTSNADLTRLRAEACKLEGVQKQESGDAAGALASFEEALKLNPSLSLKTERATVHVLLGQQALTRRDYAAAADSFSTTVSLDKSAKGLLELGAGVGEHAVAALEQDATKENEVAAIVAYDSVTNLSADTSVTNTLRDRIITVMSDAITRFEKDATKENEIAALVAHYSVRKLGADTSVTNTLRDRIITVTSVSDAITRFEKDATKENEVAALVAYDSVTNLSVDSILTNELRGRIVTTLVARCRSELSQQAYAQAVVSYGAVNRLHPEAGKGLMSDFAQLPNVVIRKLPLSFVLKLPASAIVRLPPARNSIGMELKLIPAGQFTMGDGPDAHEVTLTKNFYLGVYELTQEQYWQVTGRNPSLFKGARNPVEQVSWDDALKFCQKLSALPEEKAAGRVYRLPTEAEWEYACRAGTKTTYSFGDGESQLGSYAWYDKNSKKKTHPVGQKKPNPWMLYDMHGNVWEIVNDRYANYPSGNVTDPTEPETGEDLDKAGRDLVKQTGVELRSNRVFRGGSGSSDAERCRSANRNGNTPSRRSSACGFRVAMSPSALDQLASLQESRSGIGKVSQNAVEFISGQGDGVFQNSLGLFFKKIPAGSIKTSNGLAQTENKVVNIAQPFLIGMHEVTQDQFNLVMGENPSKFRGKSNPVESVTWFDAIEFCKRLSSKTEEQRSGNFYRLPTSDEWQLACRAGTSTKYFFGDSEKDLGRFAWYSFGNQGNTWARDNTHTTHRPIGQKSPNNFGLYDMLGNVKEWSQDQPIGLKGSKHRLRFGGGHHGGFDLEPYLRPTDFAVQIPFEETDKDESTGFRVVLEPRGSGDRGLGVAAQERFENYLSGKTPGSPDAKDLAEREKETLSSNKSTKGHSPSGSRPTSKVPARYQGLWRTRAVSFDGGKTTKQANDLPPFVYVDGDKVQSRVSGQPDRRVVSVKESSGGCHFVLDNNLVWTLADTDEGVTLLIVFAPGGKEMIRHLVVIQSKTVRSSPKPKKTATTDKQVASPATKTPAEKTVVATVKKHMTPAQLALGDPVVNSVGMLLVPIPAGTFTMGAGGEAHKVTLTKPFLLGVHEVTQQQYGKVMGKNPSKFKGAKNPVDQVNWTDAVEFCRRLSELPKEKAAGYVYRLPTEAEWEYSCRAGTTTKYSFGDSDSQLGDYAWYTKNSGRTTHPVGGKKPNGWGLYDMHGNLYEWCQDRYGKYPSGSTTDPTGAASGSDRVNRGGAWPYNSDHIRSANSNGSSPGHRGSDLGFRVLRSSIK